MVIESCPMLDVTSMCQNLFLYDKRKKKKTKVMPKKGCDFAVLGYNEKVVATSVQSHPKNGVTCKLNYAIQKIGQWIARRIFMSFTNYNWFYYNFSSFDSWPMPYKGKWWAHISLLFAYLFTLPLSSSFLFFFFKYLITWFN